MLHVSYELFVVYDLLAIIWYKDLLTQIFIALWTLENLWLSSGEVRKRKRRTSIKFIPNGPN